MKDSDNSKEIKKSVVLEEDIGGIDGRKIAFISSFSNKKDKEKVAFICAWLSNGTPHDLWFAKQIVYNWEVHNEERATNDEEKENGIVSFEKELPHGLFLGLLTRENYKNLVSKINDIYERFDSMEDAILNIRKPSKKFIHNDLCTMFMECGFPTKKTDGAFYRFNLFLYWMVYKFGIWKRLDNEKILLPCDDEVFDWATNAGILRYKNRYTLRNAITITNVAKEKYGKDEFFKFYDVIKNNTNNNE